MSLVYGHFMFLLQSEHGETAPDYTGGPHISIPLQVLALLPSQSTEMVFLAASCPRSLQHVLAAILRVDLLGDHHSPDLAVYLIHFHLRVVVTG
jgi:hypothetical protein